MANVHTPYLRQLPAVDEILRHDQVQAWIEQLSRQAVTAEVRQVLDTYRQQILQTTDTAVLDALPMDVDTIAQHIHLQLASNQAYRLQRVINATGVVIHTNLGRSLLAPEAVENLQAVAASYINLEYDLAKGERGSRYAHVEAALKALTQAEAALVVNNNAAAVFLALQALAAGREVIVSRGQLIEIGGSFRIPDIMRGSGAILREVGTTNKTHLRDYEQAINEQTAMLLRVHTSNYRIVGFTSEVALPDLARLGQTHHVAVMEDLGSGTLIDLSPYGLPEEPTVPAVVSSGVDLVTFSGDKLLGGPQAGILVGKAAYIDAVRRHPLNRAVRVDKFTIAGPSQRGSQGRGAVVFLGVVLGFPSEIVAVLFDHRPVIDHGSRGFTRFERRSVDDGFKGRARLPRGLRGTVVLTFLVVATHHRQDMTRCGLNRN